MLIFQAPAPPVSWWQQFMQQIEPYLVMLVVAVVSYLIYQLKSHTNATTKVMDEHGAQLDALVKVTPGAPASLAANPPAPPKA